MDNAVALVQAYLHVNGYFTVTEFPVLESGGATRTDLDILAVRFPAACHNVVSRGHAIQEWARDPFVPDAALGCPTDRPDMIVGEVKEGAAAFNPATRNAAVLEVGLARFGCCRREQAADIARRLLTKGRVLTPSGHSLRMVAFGATPSERGRWQTVSMSHVVDFLRGYLREHWKVLRHAQIKDATLGTLALLEKCRGVDGPTAGLARPLDSGRRAEGVSNDSM